MTPHLFWPALAEALVCTSAEISDPDPHRNAVVTAGVFLQRQLEALPLGLRVAVATALATFRAYVRLRYWSGFCALDLGRRITAVNTWAVGGFGPFRAVFRPLRNLTLLAYYEACTASPTAAAPTPHPTAPQPNLPREMQVGVLVIGSGAGGAVTALELASQGHDVLIVEEGIQPNAAPPDAGSTATMGSLYRRRGMTPILGHVPIAYVEGCCVGGSTEINSGFWHRPPTETLLRWKAQYDLTAASPEELRPSWEWAEAILGVRLHEGALPESSKVFARGARAMDWAVNEVPRTAAEARDAHATGRPAGTPGPGMSRSVIPQALAAGARLLTGCRVEKLEVKGSRIEAAIVKVISADQTTESLRIVADHFFVCAGPTETPSLLRRSGVTHNVGNSLRIHPMLKIAARFKHEMGADPGAMPLLQVKEFWPEMVLGGSFYSPGHLAVILADNWPETHAKMADSAKIACYYVGVRGTGRGRVRPSRFEDRSHIRYELSDEDMWNLSRGVARLSALLLEGGATEVMPAVQGLPAIRTEVDAVRWLDDRLDGRACSVTTVHAFSTCPIGERGDRCAADSFGKLHGFENGYINDASMVPDSPGVNPQGTIMTFARRNAQHFCQQHDA